MTSVRNWMMVGALLATVATGSMALAQTKDQGPMMGPGMMGHHMQGQGMMGWGMQGMGPGMMGQCMGPGMMGPGMQGMMNAPMMGMMMGYGPAVHGRLAYVKAELGISDAQKTAWDGYTSAVEKRATDMQEMHTAMMQAMQTGSAVERMDAHAKAMESMVADLKALKPATEALYAVLTDEQKKKADLLLVTGCMM